MAVSLRTRVCDLLGSRYPIVQAGMANYVGPELVAAVCEAGGFGILGSVSVEPDELEERIARTRRLTGRPFGVNVVLADSPLDKLDVVLSSGAAALSLSWGDPGGATARAHAAGLLVLCQVQTAAEARRANDAGVDVIIAQGSDGGGHIGRVGTMALVPGVVDAAGGVPVIAAGGIADGRGIAAALALGAEGVMLGTRFLATREAPIPTSWKTALLEAPADAAVQTDIPDIVWDSHWPGATARVLENALVSRWRADEAAIDAHRDEIHERIHGAEEREDSGEIFLYAGQSTGVIHDLPTAGALIERLVQETLDVLRRLGEAHGSRDRAGSSRG